MQNNYGYGGNNQNGYNPNGFNPNGFNPNGYNPNGFNPNGYNPNGFNPNGYNPNGYNPNGYNPYGYNPNGYNPNGYNPFNNQEYQLKQRDKRTIKTISNASSLPIIAFTILSAMFGVVLRSSKQMYDAYLTNPDFENVVYIILILLTLFIPYFCSYLFLKKRTLITELPLGKPYDSKEFLMLIPVSLMLCLLGSIFSSVLAEFFDSAFGVEFTMPEESTEYGSAFSIIIALLSTAVIPAFVEEFCIRGVVMQPLRKYGDTFALVVSAMVFGILHGNMIQIPFAFVAGLAIGYAVIRTGTMWTGVFIHFLNNAMAVGMAAIDENCSEKICDMATVIWVGILFVAGIIFTAMLLKKNSNPFYCFAKNKACRLTAGEKATAFLFTVPTLAALIILCIETAMFINT